VADTPVNLELLPRSNLTVGNFGDGGSALPQRGSTVPSSRTGTHMTTFSGYSRCATTHTARVKSTP
jgi:hypothetical protein